MILIGHNLASDLSQLIRSGFTLPSLPIFDTEVAARWCWPDHAGYGLETLALRATDMPQWRPTLGKVDMPMFDAMPDEVLAQRCGGDAEAAYRLYTVLEPEIRKNGLTKIWDLAMAMLPILSEIGGRGMAVDHDQLHDRAQKVKDFL